MAKLTAILDDDVTRVDGLPEPRDVDGWTVQQVRSPWLGPEWSLLEAVEEYAPQINPRQTLVISEKVAVLFSGRALPISEYAPGRLARLLVRFVRPRPGSRGISVPEKMQYLVRHVGVPRLLAACVVSAVTRPFGVRGAFYRVAGTLARDLDGGRPPFEHLLFPPLSVADAQRICDALASDLACGVVIADINDFGGSIRARSRRAPAARVLMRELQDNPLGQRDNRTPFVILTPPRRRFGS